MSLHLDPKTPATVEIGGITYYLRIFTQRQFVRFMVHSEAISARLSAAPDGEPAIMDEKDLERLESCLCLGIAGWEETDRLPEWRGKGDRMDLSMLDAIPAGSWMELYTEIAKANTLATEQAKNSPSP